MNGPSEEQTLPKFEPSAEQALTTFNHAAEELRFFKGQQWRVTNYALIAYAALAAAPSWVEPESWRSGVSCIASGLVVATFLAAWRVVAILEASIEKERDRQNAARDHLQLLRKLHKKHGRIDQSEMSWWRSLWNPPVKRVLIAGLLLGAVVATLINLSRIPLVQRVVACVST